MGFKVAGLISFIAASTVVTATSLVAAPAQAGTLVNCDSGCNVGSLITNGDFFDIDGDKRYSDFSVIVSQLIGGIANPKPTASSIFVSKATNGGSGITFSFPALATANNILNISLGYQLTALGNNVISSMGLSMVSGVSGDGLAIIKENISTMPFQPSSPITKLLTYDNGNPTTSVLSDFQPLSIASKKVAVQKDIQLFGGSSPGSFSSLSIVNQNPSVTAVPTPALLPGLAAFCMSIARKRKQEQAV